MQFRIRDSVDPEQTPHRDLESVDVISNAEKVDGRTVRFQHRRQELLTAAVEYVLDHGVAELSLRPMAKELGVTHATLIRHFESKEALVAEVVDHIRTEIGPKTRASGGYPADAPADRMMRAVWANLSQPAERRQFALLFELVAMHTRQQDRFDHLEQMLITEFLAPLQARFRRDGMSSREARDVATGFLALVRGLQLDLAVSGDERRVDAAMNRYIDLVTRKDS
jgi:AcrR family transcriptional regulator